MKTRLFLLQAVHTLVTLLALSSLVPMAVYAWTGEGLNLALWALCLPLGILSGLLLNDGRCVLQDLARKWSGQHEGWARDILLLPERWALNLVPATTPFFALVIGALCMRLVLDFLP